MNFDNTKTQAHWNSVSDEYYNNIRTDIKRIIENPACAFPKKTFEIIKSCLPDIKGKRICVPSSGDNAAVFAFYLMGAKVTSTDLSSEQLKNAGKIAARYGWNIEFVCQDSMELDRIESNAYDLVYTSNGAHIWISDLRVMYANFNRILKDKGFNIFFESHPFIRPFDDSKETISIIKPYEDIGPYFEAPEYHWRVQDFVNGLLSAGFTIKGMEEFHSEIGDLDSWWYQNIDEAIKDNNRKYDWRQNPWAALPQWFSICSQKTKTNAEAL